MIIELQNAWGASREEYKDLEALAQWAIQKETKLATVRYIQGSPLAKNIQRETSTPRNPDGTFRRTNNGNQNYGDPIELDATWGRPRFNISREEFQKRIREELCLKWAQPGHLARSCPKEDGPEPFKAQARSWHCTKKSRLWQNRAKIREIEIEQEPEESGNNDCPQSEMVWRTDPNENPLSLETTTWHSTTRIDSKTTMTTLWSRYNSKAEESQ